MKKNYEEFKKKFNDISTEKALNSNEEINIDNALEDRETAQDTYEEAKILRDSLKSHLNFKEKWRNRAIWGVIVFIIILLALLYYMIFKFHNSLDIRLLLLLTTVTFAHVFTTIVLILKFIFSPTKELIRRK